MLNLKEAGITLFVNEENKQFCIQFTNEKPEKVIEIKNIDNETIRQSLMKLSKQLKTDVNKIQAICSICLKPFPANRVTADVCGNPCRTKKFRLKKKGELEQFLKNKQEKYQKKLLKKENS